MQPFDLQLCVTNCHIQLTLVSLAILRKIIYVFVTFVTTL
jgi:hypothetical protein